MRNSVTIARNGDILQQFALKDQPRQILKQMPSLLSSVNHVDSEYATQVTASACVKAEWREKM